MNHTQIAHRNGASRTNTSFPQWCTAGVPSSRNIQILIVDDEEPLRNLLEASLRRTGYDVIAASSGRKALELFEQHHIDLVLLDILLPGVDGFAVCAELRKQSDVPIVMLTALSRPDDIVRGFELGADDYIPKPFTFREVEARLQAILRRIAWLEEEPTFRVLAYGDIILNDEENCVTVGGEVIDLTPIEYQLLYQLMCAPDQPISKDELFKAVWGYEEAGGTNLVEVAVRRLREKIEENPSQPNYLRTVRGAGYKFDAQYARSQQSYFQLVSPSVAYELPVAIAA